jgi:uncharacterized membrane protein
MKLPLRWKATLVAIVLALPFILMAWSMWSAGAKAQEPGYYSYFLGGLIYLLGSPLTLLIFLFIRFVRPLADADNQWAIPVMSGLFLLQWVIWAQLIVTVMNARRRKRTPHP